MTAEDQRPFAHVKSAARVLDLIELLIHNPNGMAFVEILQQTSWPRSSLHGLLRTMVERGYLHVASTGVYRIGPRLWEAGLVFQSGLSLAHVALPHLKYARDEIGETIQLAILDGIESVYLAKEESPHRLRLQSEVGSRLPAYATALGKVLLAGLSDAEFQDRLAGMELETFTPATITSIDRLRTAVAEARTAGYATDEEEYTTGVVCVAVPIRDSGGNTAAALSAATPIVRDSTSLRTQSIAILRNAAQRIAADFFGLGASDPSARKE